MYWSNKAKELYGNANMTLLQAVIYANTPAKQALCINLVREHFKWKNLNVREINEQEVTAALNHITAMFPRLNHLEQA